MDIAMISSGDEVLDGDIVDTNAAWFSQQCREYGFTVRWRFTVSDDRADLQTLFNVAAELADVVVVNGGLGPTSDDLSAEAMAEALKVPLVLDEQWLRELEQRFAARQRTMPVSNKKQAMLPKGAQRIDNPVGTACGFLSRFNNADFYFTPGVPSEFKVMVAEQILPRLARQQGQTAQPVWHRYHTFGLTESGISDRVKALALPADVRLGYRSAMPGIEVKLQGPNEDDVVVACQQLETCLSDFIYGQQHDSLPLVVQRLLLEKAQSFSSAESCTGGLVAAELVAIPGSSGCFKGGWVVYDNQMKQQQLGVPQALLEMHGAVSLPVVEAMAKGAKASSGSDYALATSGIAGPNGGSEIKPVGTVAFALVTPTKIYSRLLQLNARNRNYIRQMSSFVALDMLRRDLQGVPVCAQYEHIQRVDERMTEQRS